ncbi:cytochrome P450 [Lentinula raphanica]|nr:cytochrome P450 [Lentinula raphanica]
MNLAVAGRHTTASLLTFTVYMLLQLPAILQKLRSEILTIVGPSTQPNYDDFRNMKYLRAVLNKTSRLYPPVQSNKYTTLPPIMPGEKPFLYLRGPGQDEFKLVQNVLHSHRFNVSRCIYSVFVMHRPVDSWGPDVLTFDPDRFLDERVSK